MKPGFQATEMCALFSFHSSCEPLHRESFYKLISFSLRKLRVMFSLFFFFLWFGSKLEKPSDLAHNIISIVATLGSCFSIVLDMTILVYFGLSGLNLLLQSKYGFATAN